MQTRRFIQCDVFSGTPTKGNALAVVVDGEGLSDEQMQTFAAWTNLAETTFLLPPDDEQADYQVRIFTPLREMLFAGHPTLGSCASWLHTGGKPAEDGIVRQQCRAGIIEIDISGERPAFFAPSTMIDDLPEENLAKICKALSLDRRSVVSAAMFDNGPIWQFLELADAAAVLAADGQGVRWPEFTPIGLLGAQPASSPLDYEVRMLAPSSGMPEDPITGSLNSAIACWLQQQGRLTAPIVTAQGTCIDRDGRVYTTPLADGRILIGGDVHILIEGQVVLG